MRRSCSCGLFSTLFAAVWLVASNCAALEWEVERNFRYFVYPSDVAIQRVAEDIFLGRRGRSASPEELELLLDGADFWSSSLLAAGSQRNRWPTDWQNSDLHDVADLIKHLRTEEHREVGQVINNADRWDGRAYSVTGATPTTRSEIPTRAGTHRSACIRIASNTAITSAPRVG
jgi:hypothetical protein